jgi:hypothetical protein
MIPLPVVSTTLSAVAYDPARRLLRVQFCDGACYQYAPVPAPTFQALLQAPSLGAFFNRFIRSNFLFRKLDDRSLI